jgi:hypothetical protein
MTTIAMSSPSMTTSPTTSSSQSSPSTMTVGGSTSASASVSVSESASASDAEFLSSYRDALISLKRAEKASINALTMLADEHRTQARDIVALIIDVLEKVGWTCALVDEVSHT